MRVSKFGAAILGVGVLFTAVGLVSSTSATTNPVLVVGNAATCAGVGYAGSTQYDGSTTSSLYDGPLFTVEVTSNKFVTISDVSAGVTFQVIIVKGGPQYHAYSPPVADMRSPLVGNDQNIPALSHWFACYTYVPPVTTTTTIAPTTTTTIAPTTTTTTVDEEIELTPVPYCREVDVDGETIKEWYDVENNTGETLFVEWADGDEEIADEDTARISTAGPGIDLTVGEEVVGSSEATLDTCTTTVEFTKSVLGQPLSDTYTIRVSRLVAPDYFEELTFDIAGGQTKSFDLPSTGDESGFNYAIEESIDGGASMHSVTPDSITLAGHLGETVSVVITNSFAAISLDKQVSATAVAPGDSVDYTLIAENTGALVLDDVVISDLLPVDVTLASWSIVDDAGTCALTVATQPQTVTCELDDPLPVDGFTKAITLTVTVDMDVAADTVLLNQAKVAGFFIRLSAARTEGLNIMRAQAEGDLSCIPVPAGAVCDLSSKVGSTVLVPEVTTTTDGQSQGPVTTTTVTPTTVGKTLPSTGNGQASSEMLLLGFLLMGLGSVVVLLSRRPAAS